MIKNLKINVYGIMKVSNFKIMCSFFPNWGLAGITYVSQLVHNGVFLSYQSIERLVGRSAQLFFEYQIVRNAVNTYTASVSNPIDSDTTYPILYNNQNITSAKAFKIHIIETNVCTPTSERFWYNKFLITLNKKFWSLAFETTKESRLRELHWKILSNIYPTNILLNKMGKASDNKCTYCSLEVDFYEHFFYHCIKIKKIWESVENKFYIKFGKNISISETEALLGIIERNSISKLQLKYINHLILISKMCISKYRYGKQVEITCLFEKECLIRKV